MICQEARANERLDDRRYQQSPAGPAGPVRQGTDKSAGEEGAEEDDTPVAGGVGQLEQRRIAGELDEGAGDHGGVKILAAEGNSKGDLAAGGEGQQGDGSASHGAGGDWGLGVPQDGGNVDEQRLGEDAEEEEKAAARPKDVRKVPEDGGAQSEGGEGRGCRLV